MVVLLKVVCRLANNDIVTKHLATLTQPLPKDPTVTIYQRKIIPGSYLLPILFVLLRCQVAEISG